MPNVTRYAPPQRNDGTQPPAAHFLTHLPADPRCPTCAEAKGRKVVTPRKTEAQREEEDERLRPLDRVTLDILGPTVEALDHQSMLLTTCDIGSNMKRVEASITR